MNEIMPAVHPWTTAWYETLPEAYRTLDKSQQNPTPEAWDGLTVDPTFFYGAGGWAITDPTPAGSDIVVSYTQAFQGAAGEPVHTQIWWAAPPVDGTLIQITQVLPVSETPAEAVAEPVAGAPGDAGLMFYPTGDGVFTIRIVIFAPDTVVNMPQILAINVGGRRVTYPELPVGGITPATTRPLLRFMDGIGQLGGQFRGISDQLWDGSYTNPATVPETALHWLAQMMGVPPKLRGQLTPVKLRAYLIDMTRNGRQSTGTRTAIADAAKAFLTGSRMVEVLAHQTIPHTLIILVKADEVPGGNLDGIVATVRAAGVMPAGHDLIAREASASWDAFEAAKGTNWDQLETKAPTWTRADSLGVNLSG